MFKEPTQKYTIQWLISPTFHNQLFLEQIPKAQKDIDDLTVFIRFCDPRM